MAVSFVISNSVICSCISIGNFFLGLVNIATVFVLSTITFLITISGIFL